jgi:hypothetical protein
VIDAKTALVNPEIRSISEQMAVKMNKRPFDIAISDYFKGNDLVWKKRMGDRKKSDAWK